MFLRYEESASLYAEIDGISFEEIALKFLQVWQIEALKLFLLKVSVTLLFVELIYGCFLSSLLMFHFL